MGLLMRLIFIQLTTRLDLTQSHFIVDFEGWTCTNRDSHKNTWSRQHSPFLGPLRRQVMNSALPSRYCPGGGLPRTRRLAQLHPHNANTRLTPETRHLGLLVLLTTRHYPIVGPFIFTIYFHFLKMIFWE